MARTEQYREGRVPLHTLRADIDYAISEAQTIYGKIGIKVWIFKGEIYGKRDLTPNAVNAAADRAALLRVVMTVGEIEEIGIRVETVGVEKVVMTVKIAAEVVRITIVAAEQAVKIEAKVALQRKEDNVMLSCRKGDYYEILKY